MPYGELLSSGLNLFFSRDYGNLIYTSRRNAITVSNLHIQMCAAHMWLHCLISLNFYKEAISYAISFMIDVEIATVILSDQSFHNSIRGYSRQGFKQTGITSNWNEIIKFFWDLRLRTKWFQKMYVLNSKMVLLYLADLETWGTKPNKRKLVTCNQGSRFLTKESISLG